MAVTAKTIAYSPKHGISSGCLLTSRLHHDTGEVEVNKRQSHLRVIFWSQIGICYWGAGAVDLEVAMAGARYIVAARRLQHVSGGYALVGNGTDQPAARGHRGYSDHRADRRT